MVHLEINDPSPQRQPPHLTLLGVGRSQIINHSWTGSHSYQAPWWMLTPCQTWMTCVAPLALPWRQWVMTGGNRSCNGFQVLWRCLMALLGSTIDGGFIYYVYLLFEDVWCLSWAGVSLKYCRSGTAVWQQIARVSWKVSPGITWMISII